MRAETMIIRSAQQGLIIAARRQTTVALDELIDRCGWPVILNATPRQLHNELSWWVPQFSLFWLDDPRDVAGTTQLLAWLHAHQPAVRRIAVAYQLAPDVELSMRCASVHLYLAAHENIGGLVESLLVRWVQTQSCPAEGLTSTQHVPASPSAQFHPSGPP
jgi:hypothetical protein